MALTNQRQKVDLAQKSRCGTLATGSHCARISFHSSVFWVGGKSLVSGMLSGRLVLHLLDHFSSFASQAVTGGGNFNDAPLTQPNSATDRSGCFGWP